MADAWFDYNQTAKGERDETRKKEEQGKRKVDHTHRHSPAIQKTEKDRTQRNGEKGKSTEVHTDHCKCGSKFELYVSRAASDPGRRFWHCPEWTDCPELIRGGNNYFKWTTPGVESPAPGRDEAIHTPILKCEQCLMHPLHCICPPRDQDRAIKGQNGTA